MADRETALRGPRQREGRTFQLLDRDDRVVGDLDRVVRGAGDATESIWDLIGSGMTIWVDHPDEVEWPRVRVKVLYHFTDQDGVLHEWPEGVYVPVPESATRAGRPRAKVHLYDKTSILADDGVPETYTVDAGTVYETAIVQAIEGAGETRVQVDALDGKVLTAPLVFPPGTPRLTIANKLLRGANCFAVYANRDGVLRGQKYTTASSRGAVWDFAYAAGSVTRKGGVQHQVEALSRVPNRVVLHGRSPDFGETAGPTATAENTNPDSPYSYQARDERWITVTETEIDAADGELPALASRRLEELSQVAATWEVDHAWLPLRLNDVVLVEGRRCVVQSKTTRHRLGGGTRSICRELVST